ncbi:hypothetical protein ANCDUO_15316 [Ancylostoma duodenale]|uniref:glucuronosyltransferase n=1 Tax=Ancylostoma duodenale TaxID=51022 RepID=A0A0C2CXG9_9BILA|nr:hypothetical protein ANCDUO_15316 [Ancylostoma duodenale]
MRAPFPSFSSCYRSAWYQKCCRSALEWLHFGGHSTSHRPSTYTELYARMRTIFEHSYLLKRLNSAANGVTDDSSDISTRATNLLFTVLSVYMHKTLAAAAEQAIIKKLGPTITPIWFQETVSNMNWILVNSEPLLDFPKPTLHNIVNLGGIGVAEPKPLSQEWENVLSLREKTILISLGSVIPSALMPEGMKKTIIEVVKSYPNITFIWKYEEPDDPLVGGVQNLILSKWTPQNDLLGRAIHFM